MYIITCQSLWQELCCLILIKNRTNMYKTRKIVHLHILHQENLFYQNLKSI